jgi:dihydrofolate synthase
MDFGLSRITRLVREHNKVLPWKAFHIAGTNGKGSTSAFLSGFLHKAGVKVGRFNSPHLVHRHDCISINEQPISRSLFNEVELEIIKRDRDLDTKATPFELLTATAFEAFNRAGVDVGVVECGLGGKDDATNILLPEEVLCSIITRIGFDHKEILGPTLYDIAAAKAGIIKTGVPAVFYDDPDRSIIRIFRHRATRQLAPISHTRYTRNSKFNRMSGDISQILDLPDGMVTNVMLAWDAYKMASKRRPLLLPTLSEADAIEVAKSVRQSWRGRLQWLSLENFYRRKSPILLDGAHNPQALGSLRRYVEDHIAQDFANVSSDGDGPEARTIKHSNPTAVPITWVFASSLGKEHRECFRRFLHPRDKIFVTKFPMVAGMPWVQAENSETLTRMAMDGVKYVQHHTGDTSEPYMRNIPDPKDALRTAITVTPEESPIVVTGSLYLVGEVLRWVESGNYGRLETRVHRPGIGSAHIGSWIPVGKGPPIDRKKQSKL